MSRLSPRTCAREYQIEVLICLQVAVHGISRVSCTIAISYSLVRCGDNIPLNYCLPCQTLSVVGASCEPSASPLLKANYNSLGRVVLSITRPSVPRSSGVLQPATRLDKDLRMCDEMMYVYVNGFIHELSHR